MRDVEREQRLVAEQYFGVADQGLRDPQPLLFPAGQPPDRLLRIARSADGLDHFGDAPPASAHAHQARPPTVTVEAETHQVDAAQRQRLVDRALLRDVADLAIRAARTPTGDLDRPGGQLLHAQQRLQQAALARAVRAQHGKEFAGLDLEIEPGPEGAGPEREPGPTDPDRGANVVSYRFHPCFNAPASAFTSPVIQTM